MAYRTMRDTHHGGSVAGPRWCRFKGCTAEVEGNRKYCPKHHASYHPAEGTQHPPCTVAGCDRRSFRPDGGMCVGHCRFGAQHVFATVCRVPGCHGKHDSRGLCNKHWKRWRLYGDPLHVGEQGGTGRFGHKPQACRTPGCARYAEPFDRWCLACELAGKPWQQARRPALVAQVPTERRPMRPFIEYEYGNAFISSLPTLQTYTLGVA